MSQMIQIEEMEKNLADGLRRELRDRFAMAALTGLLAGRTAPVNKKYNFWCSTAYDIADEMLKVREG